MIDTRQAGRRLTHWPCPDLRCPDCGSTLISDGTNVWCSHVGGGGRRACLFGLTELVAESDPRILKAAAELPED